MSQTLLTPTSAYRMRTLQYGSFQTSRAAEGSKKLRPGQGVRPKKLTPCHNQFAAVITRVEPSPVAPSYVNNNAPRINAAATTITTGDCHHDGVRESQATADSDAIRLLSRLALQEMLGSQANN